MGLITWDDVKSRIRSEVNVLTVLAEMTAKELVEAKRVIAERDEEIALLKAKNADLRERVDDLLTVPEIDAG